MSKIHLLLYVTTFLVFFMITINSFAFDGNIDKINYNITSDGKKQIAFTTIYNATYYYIEEGNYILPGIITTTDDIKSFLTLLLSAKLMDKNVSFDYEIKSGYNYVKNYITIN